MSQGLGIEASALSRLTTTNQLMGLYLGEICTWGISHKIKQGGLILLFKLNR